MTKQEAAKLIAVAITAYPREAGDWNDAKQAGIAQTWARILKDYTYEQGSVALTIYLSTDRYNRFPAVGQIAGIIRDIMQATQPDDMTASEAWNIVRPAIADSYYHSQEHFDSFPPIIKDIVRDPSRLKEWGQLDSNTVDSVIRSDFCNRWFPTEIKRRRTFESYPKEVQAVIDKARAENEQRIENHEERKVIEAKPVENADHTDHGLQIAMLEEELKA